MTPAWVVLSCYTVTYMDFEIIGLTSRDKRVYDTLIRNKEWSVRSVATLTGINRGSVHESIKALISAGLVTHVKTGKSVRYVAESPEKIHEIINERRRRLLDSRVEVDSYIREIEQARTEPTSSQFASFYDGDDGMASILRDILSTCRVQGVGEYRVISSPRVSEYLYNNFQHYTRERVKHGLFVKVFRQSKGRASEADLSEAKVLQGQLFDTGCYTVIYGTKVAIISIDTYNHTSGIIIDNSGVASAQQELFDQLWLRYSG